MSRHRGLSDRSGGEHCDAVGRREAPLSSCQFGLTHPGRNAWRSRCPGDSRKDIAMNSVIYIVGLVVIVIAVLSLIGLA